ncbi:MAG TPA: alkaline phosphatase family protein [Gaiellaceae bacterium]|nr:alkaline phosphatase family protein [Gaiellaceae bacterium]
MYPIVVVLLDGLADRAHESLGWRTANEIASTPNLDRFAASGSCGVIYGVGPGRAPSSEIAHWAMLGYTPEEFSGRAVFEALGAGQDVDPDDVLVFAALRPAERRDNGWWLTGRPRYGDDEEDAAELVAACDGLEVEGLMFALSHLGRGEAVLRVSGGADDRVTDTDAFFRDRHPVLRPQPAAPEAERTARAAEAWTRRTMEVLAGHPVNERRGTEGLPAFNVATLKWWSRLRSAPTFSERHGLHGSFIADSRFLQGLGRAVGLEPVDADETDDHAADLRLRLRLIEERLVAGDTFVIAHLKATDTAGHTKDPAVKQRTIEELDAELGDLPAEGAVVCVTGDHATPTYPEVIHSGDPVPFVVAGPGVRADPVTSFGELDCAAGILGQLRGPDMMPVLLNAADRPLFLGSRPTPFAGADGYPEILEPLL